MMAYFLPVFIGLDSSDEIRVVVGIRKDNDVLISDILDGVSPSVRWSHEEVAGSRKEGRR
jgi:hypothetical protein